MKITDIKTFNVYTYRTNYVFVKIETDEGISGIGEGTLEYKEHALLGAIEDLKRVLIGQDPREVERICHELYRDSYWRVGPVLQSAISALNIAMWDIKAKALQVPLYELLGGKVRDSVRMYANVWFAGAKEPDEFAAAAKKAVAMGVTALKWDPFGKAYLYMDNQEFFEKLCWDGLERRYGSDVPQSNKDRLTYEISVVKSMGYTNYYLIVWDYINYAKSQGIPVGPGLSLIHI